MKRSDFDIKFDSIVAELNEPIMTQEGRMQMLDRYTEVDGKVTMPEMFAALFTESRVYTNQLVYQLLSELLAIED